MNWSHIYLLFHIIALCLGCVNIALSAIYLYRKKTPWVRYYFVFLIIFTTILVLYTLRVYAFIAFSGESPAFNLILGILIFLNIDFLIYFVPYFVTWIIAHPWRNPYKTIFLILAIVFFPLSILYISLGYNSALYSIMMGIFFGMILFCGGVLLKNYKSIADKRIRLISIIYCSISVCLTPALIIDTYLTPIGVPIHRQIPSSMATLSFIYAWFNIFVLIYLIDYFANIREAGEDKPDLKRCSRYKLSNREIEVAELIFQGKTNKEIADILSISINTVSNHMTNIFAKVKVSSRFDLIKHLK